MTVIQLLKLPTSEAIKATESDWLRVQTMCCKLLKDSRLKAFGSDCEFLELEFYYHSAAHPDPYVHCHPLQSSFGQWYLHRAGSSFRNGSFKGLDFTFGSGDAAYGGMLIRTLRAPNGDVINGSSLCVDYLLQTSGCKDLQALNNMISTRNIWDPKNPLSIHFPKLETTTAPPSSNERSLTTAYTTARVGLSLKRTPWEKAAPFVLRPYRFLRMPRRIKKGRPQLILALHRTGLEAKEIQSITGSPRKTIERYLDWHEQAEGRPEDFEGDGLDVEALCCLHGLTRQPM